MSNIKQIKLGKEGMVVPVIGLGCMGMTELVGLKTYGPANILPSIGFFLYFRHRGQSPGKASSALISALTGIPIGLIGGYLLQTYFLK